MKKIIYLLLTLVLLASTAEAGKWELIDNNPVIFLPDGNPIEFSMFDTETVENIIYSINKDGLSAIIKSEDNGVNWDTCFYVPYAEIGAYSYLYDLYKKGNKLFAPADNGRLYHSFDGGETWDFTFFGEKDNHPIQHIKFVNENVGFVGLIFDNILTKTTNGGKTWNPLPIANDIFPTSFSLLNFVPMDENNIVVIIKEGKIIRLFRTHDGGKNWDEFESELLKKTESGNQGFENLVYKSPYTYVESRYKASAEGHTELLRTIDFEKWESIFITDTLVGGKRIYDLKIYDNMIIGLGQNILLVSIDLGNTWVDLYDEDDDFYQRSSPKGFAYFNNYIMTQGAIIFKDEEGIERSKKKMFRYKLDLKTSVESEIANLNIYPNPAKEEINIIFDKGINSILILDLNGKAILSNNNQAPQMEQSINLDYLQTGTYFIKINDNIYKRFVKE